MINVSSWDFVFWGKMGKEGGGRKGGGEGGKKKRTKERKTGKKEPANQKKGQMSHIKLKMELWREPCGIAAKFQGKPS